jgi:putative endonuclease
MFHVYVLRSEKTGRRYVGSCEDVDERLRRHNAGDSKATRHGIPWRLVISEQFSTRAHAVNRERYFKSGRGRDELDRLEQSCSFWMREPAPRDKHHAEFGA